VGGEGRAGPRFGQVNEVANSARLRATQPRTAHHRLKTHEARKRGSWCL